MLSGHDSLIDKMRGHLAGATAYLTKPFQPATLLAAIRAYLPAPYHPPGAAWLETIFPLLPASVV